MFKHEVQYTDFNGVERKETLHFHLSTPEIIRLKTEVGAELDEYAKELVASGDVTTLVNFLQKMILNSYGRKTGDGRSFHKSPELRSEFENSPAYAEFFEQLILDPSLAEKFGRAIVDSKPKKNQPAANVVKQ